MTDEELIVAIITDPDKYGRLYEYMVINKWKWPKIEEVMRKYKLSVNSYTIDTLRSCFP